MKEDSRKKLPELPFESDGKTVRVIARRPDEAYLVLGWSGTKVPGAGAGKLPVEDGSATFPGDSELTVYQLIPIGRFPGGPCDGGFIDCPLPPPPIPVGPLPRPPKDEVIQVIVRGGPPGASR